MIQATTQVMAKTMRSLQLVQRQPLTRTIRRALTTPKAIRRAVPRVHRKVSRHRLV